MAQHTTAFANNVRFWSVSVHLWRKFDLALRSNGHPTDAHVSSRRMPRVRVSAAQLPPTIPHLIHVHGRACRSATQPPPAVSFFMAKPWTGQSTSTSDSFPTPLLRRCLTPNPSRASHLGHRRPSRWAFGSGCRARRPSKTMRQARHPPH